jgi:hypothetical protein
VLPKVFDPFFTTKQADKGSGLGLSQVHGFAHQSGGTVTIESELGRGTTITLYLPQVEEESSSVEVDSDEVDAGRGLVLVVEDNPEVAEVTVAMLGQLGYEVEAVRDAGAALSLILPVLLVTGYSHTAADISGDFVVMRKPFQLAELSRATVRLIAEAKQPPGSNVVRLRRARRDKN